MGIDREAALEREHPNRVSIDHLDDAGRVTRRTFHWPVDVREILGMGNDRHLLTDEQVAERRRKYRLSVAQPGAVVEAAKNLCLEWGDPERAAEILERGSHAPVERAAARMAREAMAKAPPPKMPTASEIAEALLRATARAPHPDEQSGQTPTPSDVPPAPLDQPQPGVAPDVAPSSDKPPRWRAMAIGRRASACAGHEVNRWR